MQSKFESPEQFLAAGHYPFQTRFDGTLLVPGSIDIANRGLTELPDLSRVIVTGNFYCHDNKLTSLKGAPAEVRGGFWCYGNQLQSLEFAPAGVTGQYICHDNKLTVLSNVPESITGDFRCDGNPLTSLEGAPKKFTTLITDWGTFDAWDKVPEELKTSPETKARMAKDAVVLGMTCGCRDRFPSGSPEAPFFC